MAESGVKMRAAFAALFVAAAFPAAAWEFTETAICTVVHDDAEVAVKLTFDPATGVYDIAFALNATTWRGNASFRILFEGANPIAIGTDRHIISDDGTILNVSDSGFGNVLDGIQFNESMTASLGDQTFTISLYGAAEPMAAFRLCPSITTS